MEIRFPFSFFESSRTALLGALAASILAACGGGGGTGGTGTTTPPPGAGGSTISTGVMTKGSTIVNGVRFEDTTANISIDDTPKTNAALQNGMVVKVAGNVNDDGINGRADRVKALVETRGRVTGVFPTENPQRLVLLNQTVLVDDQSVHSNPGGFGAIAVGTQIEIHGLRDTTGRVRATRIEDNPAQMGDNTVDEIRGVVTGGAAGNNPPTFTLGGQSVNAAAAAVVPLGASYQNGSVVEVYCVQPCLAGGVFQATRLKVEDAQDDAFRPASGQRMEAEGLISGFTAHPGNFSVGNTAVTTTSSTHFEGGIATDLANNIKVEAEGSWNGTRLVASKIEFKRSVVRLQGNISAVGPNPNQFTMNVAGHPVNIETDSQTSVSVTIVAGATCVEVRGQRKAPASPVVVTAGQIDANCSGGGGGGFRPVMQAAVEAETSTSVTLLGFSIDVSNPSDSPKWVDMNGGAIASLAAFLGAVTPATTNAAGVSVPGTLVKVSFNSGAGATTVRQAELED
jgi:hypothetical protein